MIKTIIAGNPTFDRTTPKEPYLDIAEFFCDTIQGENFVGWPSAFLRVQHCTQSCVWCDTKEVWRFGNPYTFTEIFKLMEEYDLIRKLDEGQHLVLTGGSPVRQQVALVAFINEFIDVYGFKPYIEIENEATLMPIDGLINIVDLWNNSPKLESSYNPKHFRYNPEVLKKLASLENSWFKFVVYDEAGWKEIKDDFLNPGLIQKSQIVLMPLGADRAELESNRDKVIEIAVRENVRYSTREHVVLWDKKTGV